MNQRASQRARRQVVAGLLACVLCLALPGLEASPKERVTIHVTDAAAPCRPDICAVHPSFSARQILDLAFLVALHPSVRKVETLELSVFGPDGNLHRRLLVPVTIDEPTRGGRQLPGTARPVAEQRLEEIPAKGGATLYTTSVTYPVAATDIVSRGLYGQWTVHVETTHQHTVFTADGSFELNP